MRLSRSFCVYAEGWIGLHALLVEHSPGQWGHSGLCLPSRPFSHESWSEGTCLKVLSAHFRHFNSIWDWEILTWGSVEE